MTTDRPQPLSEEEVANLTELCRMRSVRENLAPMEVMFRIVELGARIEDTFHAERERAAQMEAAADRLSGQDMVAAKQKIDYQKVRAEKAEADLRGARRLLEDVVRVARARHIPEGWKAVEEAEAFLTSPAAPEKP